MNNSPIAQKLQAIRKQKRLTLKQLSQRSGISIATLSKIENNRLSPTYEKIVALAQGLEVDVGSLFVTEPVSPMMGRLSVNRKGQGVIHETLQYQYQMLHNDLQNKKFIPLLTTLKAFERHSFPKLLNHEGEEFLYVLSGQVILYTECYAPITLNSGDSCYYDSNMGHAVISASTYPAQILWVAITFTRETTS